MVQWGYDTQVSFNNVDMELVSVGGPSIEQGQIDVTTMSATNRWRQFIDALRDAGEVTLTVHHDPTINYKSDLIEAGVTTLTITEPKFDSASGSKGDFSCDAFVTGYEPTRELEDRTTAEITFKLSGEPSLTLEA